MSSRISRLSVGDLLSVVERLGGSAVFAVLDSDPDEASDLGNDPHEECHPGSCAS